MTDAFGGTPLPPISTSSPGNKQPLTVWYDPLVNSDTAQQPHAQQVAAFEAVPNDLNQAVLDVNQHFLVYAVKNGLLRVLHRSSSVRSLLRGHVSKVTCVNFFQNGDVLGTVGGNVIIWRLFYRSPEILSEKLLEIPTTSLTGMTRLIWHPFNPNQFWLMLDNSQQVKVATLVETTRITTIQAEEEDSSHAVCQVFNNTAVMDGAVLIQEESSSSNMNDLSWSGKDTKHVLTCHDNGTIRLWNVKKLGDSENGLAPAECVVTLSSSDSEEAVTRCMFLPHDNIVSEQDEEGMTSAFLTASRDNSVITLWSAFYANRDPTKLQVFGIKQSPTLSSSYNINLAYGPASPEQPTFFVLLSDRSSGKVYTLHLNTVWSQSPPKRALVVGFDYIVPFSLKYPIYSWSIACVPAENVSEEEDASTSGLNFDIRFFAYQSKMVQQYTLPHYMCLPPGSEWSSDTAGVQVESLSGMSDAAVPMSNVTTVEMMNEEEVMQDYDEDYELEEVDEEEDNDDLQAPEASSLPVPDGLGGGGTTTSSSNVDSTSSNPFANWLGAIAAKTTGASGSVPPPPTPATSTSSSAAVSSDGIAKAAPMPSMEPTMLLNPAELLSPGSMSDIDQAMEALPTSKPQQSEPKKKKSSSASKSNGGKNKTPPRPAQPQPKIAILKRGEESQAAPAVSSPAASTGAPLPGLEQVLNKTLTAHFKRQETYISEQVQKAVKSEMQTTVVPTLSKMITQTMEQAVVKPVKAALDKNAKERTKVQSDVIVNAVSTSVEEPLKNAFQTAMATALVPAYEVATREMFLQVSSSLEKGLAGGHQSTDSSLIEALSAKLDTMSRNMESLTSEVVQLRSAVASSQGMAPATDASIAESAVPPPDTGKIVRETILDLLSRRDYETAFTQALSASAADMAVFCCKNASVSDVLSGDDPALSQPILLCLMQQLGAVLVSSSDDDLQTILLWVQEIALTLDPSNEGVQRHVPGVLQQLVASIDTKMAEGDPTLRRSLQMLRQVIRGMQR